MSLHPSPGGREPLVYCVQCRAHLPQSASGHPFCSSACESTFQNRLPSERAAKVAAYCEERRFQGPEVFGRIAKA